MTQQEHGQGEGSVKQVAGALNEDRHLKNEGRAEEAKGSAKDTVDKVAATLTGRNRNKKQA
jgi:uncharacterized protein YjbJ (UPF0337 family)